MAGPVTATRRVLLDTCVLIDLESIDLGEVADAEAVLSAVTIGELAYRLNVTDPVERLARSKRYDAAAKSFEILPFDAAVADYYGALAALVRDAGRNPRPRRLDLQIGATAAASGLSLVTRNVADFEGLERLVHVIGV